MDNRSMTTSAFFRLAKLILPEHVLLQWFGRKIPVRAGSGHRR